MKKNFLSILVAIVCFSASGHGQSTQKNASGCNTDCFFTDCTVICPTNSIPKCKCVLGSFGSCGCQQTISKDGTSVLPVAKNQSVFPKVLIQLNKSGFSAYANLMSALNSALVGKNSDSYQQNFAALDAMATADPATAAKVEAIIAGNFQ